MPTANPALKQQTASAPPASSEAELILAARRHCRIAHHVPGRIRLRFDPTGLAPLLHGRSARLEAALRRVPGIGNTEINLAACSLIVHYDPRTLPPASWDQLLNSSPAESAALAARLFAFD
jgi:hypothetical protein